jgi:RNA polymerase sigma-70 factor (ECF subfamily)
MVYGVCRVLLRDADEAEDAAQQVFLSAHRSMLGGTQPRDPAAWLGTIARHECQSRLRARMATPLTLVDERHAASVDVEDVAGQHAEVAALCAALGELPQQQREAIVLREFYGLSYDEVRAALGVSDAAVESLLFRARKRLQAELRPARVALGAFALPWALRDALAASIPGFSSGTGGTLAKLASVPLVAKLVGAAATLTAAGTIAYVEIDARDHEVGTPVATRSAPRHRAADLEAQRALARTPLALTSALPLTRRAEHQEEAAEERDEVEDGNSTEGESENGIERENTGEGFGDRDVEASGEQVSESGESGESSESSSEGD